MLDRATCEIIKVCWWLECFRSWQILQGCIGTAVKRGQVTHTKSEVLDASEKPFLKFVTPASRLTRAVPAVNERLSVAVLWAVPRHESTVFEAGWQCKAAKTGTRSTRVPHDVCSPHSALGGHAGSMNSRLLGHPAQLQLETEGGDWAASLLTATSALK